MQASELLSESKLALLEKVPEDSKCFFKWFFALTELYRPSHHCEGAMQTLKTWADKLGVKHHSDEAGNTIFEAPATPGKESVPSICVQGHLDIVAVGQFLEGGKVPLKIENGVMLSGVSTIGSDDGVAVATGLAILEQRNNFEHGPIEVLVTVDEEVGLLGAGKLAGPPFLKSRTLINVDSEEWDTIYTSCAGGINMFYDYPLQVEPANGKVVKVHVYSFVSGHTGICIQEGRQNAVKWMTRIFTAAYRKGFHFNLVSIAGGDKHNAIPAECTAVISNATPELIEFIKNMHADLVNENAVIEKKVPKIEISDATATEQMTEECSEKVCALINTIYHGVFVMHPEIEGLVLTSQSLSIVWTEGHSVKAQVFARTNESSHMDWLMDMNKSVAKLAGAKIDIPEDDIMGPWPAALGSKIMDVAKGVWKEMWGKEPHVTGIHAGLECGCIQNRGYPDLEAISYGPTIIGAHTVEENCSVEDAHKCYLTTVEIVKKWANQ